MQTLDLYPIAYYAELAVISLQWTENEGTFTDHMKNCFDLLDIKGFSFNDFLRNGCWAQAGTRIGVKNP